jgi:hypothetical protein
LELPNCPNEKLLSMVELKAFLKVPIINKEI